MFAGIIPAKYLIMALFQAANTLFAGIKCHSMLGMSPSELYSHVGSVSLFSRSSRFHILLSLLLVLIEDS